MIRRLAIFTAALAAVLAGLGGLYIKGRSDGAASERVSAIERTEAAIHEVQNLADRARAMRRHCADNGLQYDFPTGKCVGV